MHHDEETNDSHLQHEAEHAKPGKKNAVLLYLVILFAAAFLLLLLSYFMQQRTNQERYDDLEQTSNSAVQTLDNMLQENEDLKARTQELEEENQTLQDELDTANQSASDLEKENRQALAAMDWFWRVQRQYSRGRYNDARALIASFEATGLPAALPTEDLTGLDGTSPAQQYRDILELLGVTETTAPVLPTPFQTP